MACSYRASCSARMPRRCQASACRGCCCRSSTQAASARLRSPCCCQASASSKPPRREAKPADRTEGTAMAASTRGGHGRHIECRRPAALYGTLLHTAVCRLEMADIGGAVEQRQTGAFAPQCCLQLLKPLWIAREIEGDLPVLR